MVKNSMPGQDDCRQFDPDLVGLSRQGHIHWSVHYQPTAASTQDLARQAAAAGAAEGWTVVTDWQEAGRGRLGRAWVAGAGSDLLFSTVLRPPGPLLSLLPLLAGVAIAEGLRIATGLQADLKWPNDLLVDERKLAGILLERGGSTDVVVGVGMNVNSVKAGLPAGTTSVAVSLGRPVSRERLLGSMLEQLDHALAQTATEGTGWIVR
ncbi:MAG: biotin--[acetyl-CoA-carboxylase] ligase, partial [Candidatus Dormibacteraeota bacterium]|nr:biotin--[acetyl-CoA-carboxylase] ligase [Candidatus Dormibacteraeota bacterium]